MREMIEHRIIDILMNVYNMSINNPCINERYLHHYFTEKIQKEYPIIYSDLNKSKLHPEWATANQLRMNGGKYKKNGNKYEIDNNGTSGFIDFVFGDYENPKIGIEFKCTKSWHFQSIVFDYMKLLDNNNSLQKTISFSIVYRDNKLSNQLTLNKINQTIDELRHRLNSRLETNRSFLFWIIEIAVNTNDKKSWYCTNLDEKFLEGVPL